MINKSWGGQPLRSGRHITTQHSHPEDFMPTLHPHSNSQSRAALAAKPALLSLALAACLLATAPSFAASPTMVPMAGEQMLDRIVAVVNQSVITQRQLNEQIQLVAMQNKIPLNQLSPSDIKQLQERVLDRMITEKVELERAKQIGISVEDARLDDALTGIAQRNGMSLGQLQQAVTNQGDNWASYRESIRKQIMIDELKRREVFERVNITDREVDDYLKQYTGANTSTTEYHLAQILISVPENASPAQVEAAKKRADAVIAALKSGEAFTQVSAERSDAPDATKGGDLGWRDSSRIPSLFAGAIKTLKPGEISGIIRSPNGFHIIKLEGVRTASANNAVLTEFDAEHVLIQVNSQRNAAQARAEAENLRQQIISGKASFAAIAAKYSDDKGSAAQGGQLGWVKPADMVPEFADMLEKTPVGQISPVFQTEYGFHFLEVLKTRDVTVPTETLRAQARQAIGQRRADEDLVNYIRRLRAEAYIDNRLTGSINDSAAQ
jgi:peptidyl-prolyl cis-trans isomerase SurA